MTPDLTPYVNWPVLLGVVGVIAVVLLLWGVFGWGRHNGGNTDG